jgi:KGK domain
MDNEFKPLNKGEIISLNHQEIGRHLNLATNGFADVQIKAEQLEKLVTRRLNVKDSKGQTLFKEGITCETLMLSASGWQKGRLRAKLILEFCPDNLPVEEEPIIDKSNDLTTISEEEAE